MENHPIPQDVTGFQFKLIGNMTIKQFGYVAFGVILAVILYYLPLNSFIGAVIKIVFIPLLGSSGIALAFLPIEGRPIDTMIANFLKALFSPNQYIYQKAGRMFSFSSIAPSTSQPQPQVATKTPVVANKSAQLQQFMEGTNLQALNKLDQRESAFIQSVFTPETSNDLTSTPAPSAPAQAQPVASPQPSITKIEPVLQPMPILMPTPSAQQPKAPIIAAPAPTPVPPKPTAVQAKKTDLPYTPDVPNVIVGIVKDPRGNVLPNILVEVKDKLGNPIRAFKTNALGQFASATPLLPGSYTVELEDPKKQNTFTVIQLTADNRILLPIEIVSHDAREELRRQLFSN